MFSIVIPLYNKAHTIVSTLKSVLAQTYNDYEVVVVNDGSTDDGVKVIQAFTSDSRIRIVSQENQGISGGRNRGIKESKFEYVAFLDGDDEWLPDYLFEIKKAIEKHPDAAMIGTASIHKDVVTGEAINATVAKYRNKTVEVDCFKNPAALPHTSAMVIKKSALKTLDEEYNAFPVGMRAFEDYACFYRIALTQKLVYIGVPFSIRNNNVAGQFTRLPEEELLKLFPDIIRFNNLMYQHWLKSKKDNSYFIPFLRYELRHRIKNLIQRDDEVNLGLLSKNLDKGFLNSFEMSLYSSKRFSTLAIWYVYSTKLYAKIFDLISLRSYNNKTITNKSVSNTPLTKNNEYSKTSH